MRKAIFMILILWCPSLCAQQAADLEFNTTVEHPAYTKNYPRVLFDEAHNNFHTITGRYKPFADLMVSDGYHLVRNRKPFTKASLATFKILIIANALGAEDMDDEGAANSAFTDEECDTVLSWVRSGGSLLLIADHAPFGGAAAELAKRFGIEMSNGYTFDPEHSLEGEPSILVYSVENKLLREHPITSGRDDQEKITRVIAFTGEALKGPQDSIAFLQLADTARDRPSPEDPKEVSVAGQSQGLAMKAGKGRVVALGEAGMITAQVVGLEKERFGMNVPGTSNRQLALNIMHWLSGILK